LSSRPNLPGSSGLIVIGYPSPSNTGAAESLVSTWYPKIKFETGFFSKHIFLQYAKYSGLCRMLRPCPILAAPALIAISTFFVKWSLVYPAWYTFL